MKIKIKTKKSAAKRFKITSTGKVKRYNVGRRHLLEHKATKSKRYKRKASDVSDSDMKKLQKMLPGVL
jgi:large subunit ribosomal protein L35